MARRLKYKAAGVKENRMGKRKRLSLEDLNPKIAKYLIERERAPKNGVVDVYRALQELRQAHQISVDIAPEEFAEEWKVLEAVELGEHTPGNYTKGEHDRFQFKVPFSDVRSELKRIFGTEKPLKTKTPLRAVPRVRGVEGKTLVLTFPSGRRATVCLPHGITEGEIKSICETLKDSY